MNYKILGLGFLVMVLLKAGVCLGQRPGNKDFIAAENLRKQNKYGEAIVRYDRAIKLEPSNYKYYFQKGKCEYRLNLPKQAKASFKLAIEFNKNFPPAYSLLAKIFKDEKDFENAIFYYELAAENESGPARKAHYKLLLVNLLLGEDRIEEARKHINEAGELAPTNVNVIYYQAEMFSYDGDWENAKSQYERAMLTDRFKSASIAEKAKYYYGIGLAHQKLGEKESAKRYWDKINFEPYKSLILQELLETNHVYYYNVAIGYYLNEEYPLSSQFVEKALEINAEFASAYVLRGKIQKKEGRLSDAIVSYRKAIEVEPVAHKQGKMWALLAGLHMERKNYVETLQALREARNAGAPYQADLRYMQARAEYRSRQYAKAILTLESLVAITAEPKEKAKYNFLLGMAAKASEEKEKAREAFKRAMHGAYRPAARLELEKLN